MIGGNAISYIKHDTWGPPFRPPMRVTVDVVVCGLPEDGVLLDLEVLSDVTHTSGHVGGEGR